MGFRERKQEQTRRRLAQASRELFAEHGYENTTVAMIADVAGVSSRTFYRYFESKAGVVAEPGYRLIHRMIDRLPPHPTFLELIEQLTAAVEEGLASGELEWALRLHRENPELIEGAPLWHRRWAELLAGGLATVDGRRTPSLQDRARSTAAVHLIALVADEWKKQPPETSFSELARQVTDTLLEDFRRKER